MVVYDIGAHAGFFTLMFSRLAGPSGSVVAFEPLPRNVHHLRANIALNRLRNVSVMEAAVSDASGTASLLTATSTTMGRIAEEGTLTVKLVQLDELVENGAIPRPQRMKIDVEGAELTVLQGARALLADSRPSILLATHGAAVRAACVALLEGQGYSIRVLPSDRYELLALPNP